MKKLGACLIALFLVVGSSVLGPQKAVSVASDVEVQCGENQFQVPKLIPDPRRSVEIICVDNVEITGTL